MNSLNSLLIEGDLLTDPLFRYTPRGTAVCTFKIVHERFYNGREDHEVSHLNIESWGKLAENCNNLGTKGRKVRIVGRLKQERWTGADGKEKERVIIVAEHVEWRPERKEETSTRGRKKGNNGE